MSPCRKFSLDPQWHTPCYDSLSALDWADGFGVVCHGVSVGIRASDAELIPLLKKRLQFNVSPYTGERFDCVLSVILGGKQPGSNLRNFHISYHNHSVIARSHQQEEVLDRFSGSFSLSVATLSPDYVFIHAGVVEWQGRAILIPGQSLAGKSTLVMALVRAGATYLSDEFALLDANGMVHPFAKPISMRQPGKSRQVDIPVESFGGLIGTEPVPLGLVLDTAYEKGAQWCPQNISRGEGVLALLANCPAAHHAPERVLSALNAAASDARMIRSPRGDCSTIVPKILNSTIPDRSTAFAVPGFATSQEHNVSLYDYV